MNSNRFYVVPPHMTDINGHVVVMPPELPVQLGNSRNGVLQVLDLACCRNILVASTNNADIDYMLDLMIRSASDHKKKESLQFIFSSFRESPLKNPAFATHLHVPVIESEQAALRVLDYLYDENVRRFQLFNTKKAQWIIGFNECVSERERLPYLIYFIDEFSGLVKKRKADFCRKIRQVTTASKFTGVFLVFATKEVSQEVVSPEITRAFQKKIVFRMKDSAQSRLLLGCEGAEKLGPDKIFLLEPKEKPKKIKLECEADYQV